MGTITPDTIPMSLLYVPIALAANLAGSNLALRMNVAQFQRVKNVILFLIGSVMIWRGLKIGMVCQDAFSPSMVWQYEFKPGDFVVSIFGLETVMDRVL